MIYSCLCTCIYPSVHSVVAYMYFLFLSDLNSNFHLVLFHLSEPIRQRKAKQLGYFNALVRLCYRYGNEFDSGFSIQEVLCWSVYKTQFVFSLKIIYYLISAVFDSVSYMKRRRCERPASGRCDTFVIATRTLMPWSN